MNRPMESVSDVRDQVSAEEWQIRVDLAACYRLVAHFGWDDLIYTHISARVPDTDHHFLINPFGHGFDEITASSLVKIDLHGDKVIESPYPVNKAGFVIHSAIHEAREDAGCVLHLHTEYGTAVSMQKDGLQPANQTAVLAAAMVSYHDFEGIATRDDEKVRLVEDIGAKPLMILRNHGTLAVGRTVPEAFLYMYFLERACKMQILAQTGGKEIHPVSQEAMENTLKGAMEVTADASPWPALIRKLDRLDSSYRN